MKDSPASASSLHAVPLFPFGLRYFRAWRSVRWFIALCIPILASAAAVWRHGHGFFIAAFLALFGAVVSAWIFVAAWSGLVSSTWGTHERKTAPAGYWTQLAVLAFVYLGLAIAGHVVTR